MEQHLKNEKSDPTPPILGIGTSWKNFKRRPVLGCFGLNTGSTLPPPLAVTVARFRGSAGFLRKSLEINNLRSILARLRRPENKFSGAPRFDCVKFASLWNQRLTAVVFSALLALSVTLGHAQAQEPAERPAAMAPESPAEAQAQAQSGPQGEPAPNPAPVAGNALADYLRALAQAQAARADALQAQGEAMRAQQALAQAIERAQQAQSVLSALVSARAKESGAADGWRLGLDGKWLPPAPPAEAQATQ